MKERNKTIRAVQLDLARQMETISFIREFIDTIAEYHFNTLFLYLEWRIRTKTVDLGTENGYSAEELSEIVDYAEQRGISVIPGIATLGHCEQLLQTEKYAHFNELRNGLNGRINSSWDLCISHPEIRSFLRSYIGEVCGIFKKSPWIHVGGDESWNIGYCELCRDKAAEYSGEQNLYLEHFLFIADVLKEHGRRPMLWDDMFEFYPDILEAFPREFIMVSWQYQRNVDRFRGHFFNQVWRNVFQEYDRLGFDYIFAPSVYYWDNIESFTDFASRSNSCGVILTIWEKKISLLYKNEPVIAAAGEIWNGTSGSADEAFSSAVKKWSGLDDPLFISALKTYSFTVTDNYTGRNTLTCFNFFGPENFRLSEWNTVRAALLPMRGRMKNSHAELILNDIIADIEQKMLRIRSVISAWKLLHNQPGESLESLVPEVEKSLSEYAEFIRKYRRSGDGVPVETMRDNWCQALQEVAHSVRNSGILRCTFALPDGFGSQKFKLTVISTDGTEIRVADGCYKHEMDSLFECFFFLPKTTDVRAVRIESSGYAGAGICFIEVTTDSGLFLPDSVENVTGNVEHPELMLKNNVNFAFFGIRQVEDQFRDRSLARLVSGVTLKMKRVTSL